MTAALAAVPRSGFLPTTERSRAAYDGPLPIGHAQTSSQPRTVEAMLRLLDVHPGHRVLDVGAGSGWTTALLAHLVGHQGFVLGTEIVPALAQWGADNLASTGFGWASLEQADPDVLGSPGHAPYDRILVSANAAALPWTLVDQLVDPGRMVLPVASRMTLVVSADGQREVTEHGTYRFVPLT